MTDIFEEVEEQLRSERYIQLLRRVWPWALAAALIALAAALGWWAWQGYRAKESAKASEGYAAALDTLQAGDSKKAFSMLEETRKHASRGYKTLALMQEGGIRMDEGKTEEAVELFDQAASSAPSDLLADMARLKSAFALLDTAPYAALEQRLKPLIDPKRPFSPAAREALAMAKLRAGRLKEARADFVVLRLLPDGTDGIHRRASLAIDAIDSGSAAQIPAVVKAELAAPPAPAITLPPQLLQGAPAQGAPAPAIAPGAAQ